MVTIKEIKAKIKDELVWSAQPRGSGRTKAELIKHYNEGVELKLTKVEYEKRRQEDQ